MYDHTSISSCVIHPDGDRSNYSWLYMMQHEPKEWARCVNEIFYCESCLDASPGPWDSGDMPVCLFKCTLCDPTCAFATNKALQSHTRAKHKVTSLVPRYIDDSGTCPACLAFFGSRVRVISHLSDTRRPKCRDRVLAAEFPSVATDIFDNLQERDRTLRRQALRAGHTHPIAVGAARTAEGRRVGHVKH